MIFTKSKSGSRLFDYRCWPPIAPVSEHRMVEIIQDLIHFLAKDQLTINEVIARVGHIDHDPDARMPIRLRSALPGVHLAELAGDPDSGLPHVLILELSPDPRLAVVDLQRRLAVYERE